MTQSGNIKAAAEAFPARLRRTHPQHTAAPAALQTGSTHSPLSPDDGDSRPVSPSAQALIGLTSKSEDRKSGGVGGGSVSVVPCVLKYEAACQLEASVLILSWYSTRDSFQKTCPLRLNLKTVLASNVSSHRLNNPIVAPAAGKEGAFVRQKSFSLSQLTPTSVS